MSYLAIVAVLECVIIPTKSQINVCCLVMQLFYKVLDIFVRTFVGMILIKKTEKKTNF